MLNVELDGLPQEDRKAVVRRLLRVLNDETVTALEKRFNENGGRG